MTPNRPEDSKDEKGSIFPVFDAFYECGAEQSVQQVTKFDKSELHSIWDMLSETAHSFYYIGAGRKSLYRVNDESFMKLEVLKHGGNWDILPRFFGMKAPTFERLVATFIDMICRHAYTKYISEFQTTINFADLLNDGVRFRNYATARYATDVILQQAGRPRRNI